MSIHKQPALRLGRGHGEMLVEVVCYKPVPDQGPHACNQTPCPWQR